MQAIKAEALRRAWRKKSCAHREIEKEYHLDKPTGDYVCSTCGKMFTSREAQQRGRKSAPPKTKAKRRTS